MKKTVAALAVLALALPGMAQARAYTQDRPEHQNSAQYRPDDRGPQHREQQPRFARGDRFEPARAPGYRVVDYREVHGLRAPPQGYRYVRSGDDILLVAITSGVIGAVLGGLVR